MTDGDDGAVAVVDDLLGNAQLGRLAQMHDGPASLETSRSGRLAGFAAEEVDDAGEVLLERVGELDDVLGALVEAQVAPPVAEGLVGVPDGVVDILAG